ncbi:MAG: hypothetical protein OHK0029_11700 [Armatimonadaceae bacterium]
MLTDDSPEDRYLIRRLLQREGEWTYEILEESTGEGGLACCFDNDIDCVLLDYRLPDMEAPTFLAAMYRDNGSIPACPVVVLTSFGGENAVLNVMKAGAQDYLRKSDLTYEALTFAINSAIEKVTLRQQVEESEHRFREALENMLDAYGIYRAVREPLSGKIVDFRVEYVNQAACVSNNLPADQQVGRLLSELLPVVRTSGLLEEYIRVAETGESLEPTTMVFRNENIGGVRERERFFEIRIWKMGDGVAVSWRDVTRQRQTEQQRDQAEARLQQALSRLAFHVENTPLANVEWDEQFRVVSWSAQAEEMFGWTAAEVLGKRHDEWDFVHPDDAAWIQGEIQRGVSGETDQIKTVNRNLHKDGSVLYCEWYTSILRDEQGRLESVLSLVQNVTEREEALQRLHDAYQHEHEIAAALQRSLLMRVSPGTFHGLEVVTHYEAAQDEMLIGGDFYDAFAFYAESPVFHSTGGNRNGGNGSPQGTGVDPRLHVALVVGDVTGKGIEAATFTAEVKFALRAFLHEGLSAAEALKQLNRFLCGGVQDARRLNLAPASGGFDSIGIGKTGTFVAMSLVVVHILSGEATFVSAGAEPPLVLSDHEGAASWTEISAFGPLLGIDPEGVFASMQRTLQPHDTIVMTTDGLTEARRSRSEFFGLEGVAHAIHRLIGKVGLEDMSEIVVEEARRFAHGQLRDDACLLIARRT